LLRQIIFFIKIELFLSQSAPTFEKNFSLLLLKS
jgi:hypothetical protein